MLVAATRRGEPRCSSTHAVTDTSSPPSPLLAGGGGMDYCRRVNPFRMCAGLWVRGYLMVALVSAIVAVSYYTVVVYAWGPLLLGGGVAAAAAAAVLAAFHLLVNDAIIVGQPLVSCSSNTTLKVWNCLSDGACTRTLRQHSDYVICLAAADKNSNIVASGGLGGEVFIWDLDAALAPVAKSVDGKEDEIHNGNTGPSSNIVSTNGQSHGHSPIAAQGHKDSVYTLAMNDTGTLLVSGGTEKVVRVWDPRTGSKNMKLRGHTDNIRALLLDSTGRYCLSGSSDSMIRLWDLGQQRCVHSSAVHTDSVWALASTPSFAHVYSVGRDQSVITIISCVLNSYVTSEF